MFAVNCCVRLCTVFALAGEITNGEVMVAVVDAVWPLPSVAVAVIVQEPGASGAVNDPVLEMVPQLAFHVAAPLAVNDRIDPSCMPGFSGLMVKVEEGMMVS
jgi:hypothetical protein